MQEQPAASARDQWRERIAEHARSGLSIKQFCKDRGIAEHSSTLGASGCERPSRYASLWSIARRTPQAPEWNLELLLVTGERLRIGAGVDAATLRTVMEALRA